MTRGLSAVSVYLYCSHQIRYVDPHEQIAKRLQERTVLPTELLRACTDAIQSHQSNAVVHSTKTAEAEALVRQTGGLSKRKSRLDGLPILVKENLLCKDASVSAASDALKRILTIP